MDDFRDASNTRIVTVCQCGATCIVVPDPNDKMKFHFECLICGKSTTVTRTSDIEVADGNG